MLIALVLSRFEDTLRHRRSVAASYISALHLARHSQPGMCWVSLSTRNENTGPGVGDFLAFGVVRPSPAGLVLFDGLKEMLNHLVRDDEF